MIFLQPWWWLLALLALPLVLWHARNPRDVEVPSLRIWRAVAPETASPNLDVRRFRPRLDRSLWLHLLALLALVLALTGPRPADVAADHHVWVIDRSASMAAPDGEGSRLEAAVRRAIEDVGAVDPAVRGGPVLSAVSVGAEVAVPVARAANAHDVREALRTVTPEAVRSPMHASRLRDVIEGLVAPSERTRVTVLTDGPGVEGIERALVRWSDDEGVRVEVETFGEAHDTHGFASVRAVPLDPEERRWRIEGEVLAYPPPEEPLTIEASFVRDGLEGALPWEDVTVRPRSERTPFAFETEFPGSGLLTLRLPEDVLPRDDVARISLRAEPVPLRVWTAGEVPGALIGALEAIDAAQVELADDGNMEPEENAYDLAVVGPGASWSERPAPTVLWLAGVRADGDRGVPVAPPGAVSPGTGGTGGMGWTGIEDIPEGALDEVFVLPAVTNATVLSWADEGPLLQVHRTSEGTDVHAAWNLGTTLWARELGFARFVTELAIAARPLHGAWTDARCLVGDPCPGVEPGVEARAPGVHEAAGQRWIVDVEAGPEIDLRSAAAEATTPRAAPWHRFDRGLAAIAALLVGIDAARAWRRRRDARVETGRLRRWASVGARLVATVALLAIAAGVPVPTIRLLERTAVLLEPEPAAENAGGATDNGRPELQRTMERAAAVVWAEGAGRLAPALGSDSETVTSGEPRVPTGYDFGASLELAAAALGADGGRLVVADVHGDDVPPDPDVLATLRERGVTVDVVPAPSVLEEEVWVEAIHVSSGVRAGDTATIRVAIGGSAAADHRVRISVDGDPLERTADANGRTFTWEPVDPGLRELRAELVDAEDDIAANDAIVALVDVAPAGRVALVAQEGEPADALARRLEERGFEVDALRARDVPTSVDGFLDFDLVVLSDVPAVDLHALRQEALERWVREYGGGVIIGGARRAYGPGGYLQTPLEDLSPLSARVPGEQPQAAIAFVLDRSGSMQQTVGGVSRLALTKAATVEAVDLLHPESEVAIVAFDDVAHLLKPLGSPEDVAARLGPVTAGGGTNLYPALQAAFDQLRGTNAEARHMIVMTDGLAQAAPFDPLIEEIVQADVTISTVAVGRGADVGLLQDMARSGGGVFHRSEDVRALPSILSQEAMLLSGDPVREGAITPNLEPGEAAFLDDLPDTFPELPGYVRTTQKPEAEVHARTSDGDPILASWRHGIGRVVALATPLEGEWAEAWLDGAYGESFLRQGLRWAAAPLLRPGIALDVRREGDALAVAARVVGEEGEPIEGAHLVARAVGPEGEERGPVRLGDTGRGAYEARLSAFAPGRYEVRVERLDGGAGEDASAEQDVHISYPASLGFGTGRTAIAADAARATGGGVVLDADATLVRSVLSVATVPRMAPWVWLAIGGIALALVLDALRVHSGGRAGPRFRSSDDAATMRSPRTGWKSGRTEPSSRGEASPP